MTEIPSDSPSDEMIPEEAAVTQETRVFESAGSAQEMPVAGEASSTGETPVHEQADFASDSSEASHPFGESAGRRPWSKHALRRIGVPVAAVLVSVGAGIGIGFGIWGGGPAALPRVTQFRFQVPGGPARGGFFGPAGRIGPGFSHFPGSGSGSGGQGSGGPASGGPSYGSGGPSYGGSIAGPFGQ